MKNNLLCQISFALISTLSYAQVGIGTSPKAYLHVPAGRTVLFGEDTNFVSPSSKLIWYGNKGALRAGNTLYTDWNYDKVGFFSLATGNGTIADGYCSTAMGGFVKANGNFALAIGTNTTASGYSSAAMGQSSTASGYTSLATGYVTTASGQFSTAMGAYVSTNEKVGSFIIGDNNLSNTYSNRLDNQMIMRFQGGYVLYSNSPADQNVAIGVELKPGQSAWSVISDSTRKENFRSVNGAVFLQKIAGMRLGSWNYKGQNAKHYRHYGPMAQDFFTAFGRDELGTIGEDKRINQADFDGVNLIAIQALINEVEQLKVENNALRNENASVKNETASIKSDMEQIKKQLATLLKQ